MITSSLRALTTRKFALAAFLIPLGIRAIPEVLVGPYPIGWDTISFYVPNTLDWAAGKAGLAEIVGTAPLMYMISVPVFLLSRVNPVWIFKIMGPLLYGTMIVSLFRFLQIGLKWPDKQALGAALLTSLYFVTLRISWDMYRNMLGLTFILLSLPLFCSMNERRSRIFLAVLLVMAAASDQLTGVIALSLIAMRALVEVVRARWDDFVRLVKVGAPSLLFFLGSAYSGVNASGVGLVQQQATMPGLDSLVSSVGFLGYVYLPILPLILLGLRRVVNADLRNWALALVGLSLTALVPFSGFVVMSYRWSLLLDIPLCVYASAGISRILDVTSPIISWRGLIGRKALPIFSLALMVSAGLYTVLPAQNAILYYSVYPNFMPTSMVQDTVPISDMPSLQMILNWVRSNMHPSTVLITHQAIYGWARAYLPSNVNIVNYRYSDPLEGVKIATSSGHSSVWMIWWINGKGWHGQPYVPNGFVPIITEGSMALYAYY